MENPDFLKKKYDLHKAPEVEKAAQRTEKKTGEKVPQNPDSRIQNYLDRLERLVLDPEKKQKRKMMGASERPQALFRLREMVMNKYVRPNKEKMAEGAARVEERAARELGMEARYGEQELEQRGQIAVKDLEKSLDNWISYLSDTNESYPTWFRYYAFRNVFDLGDYDKDKKEFTKRSQGTARLFPEIDRGALAYVEERIEAAKNPATLEKLRKAQEFAGTPKTDLITKEKAGAFAKLSFARQYAEGIKQSGEITPEMREETEGKWVKYQQGTDSTALWASLQNKGTAWCTKGFATAETQLQGGDFYVYYTLDKQGNPAIPRIAIRMNGNNIAEVRGVSDNDQNLEGNMTEIAEEKMKELPGAERYREASADMKQLTEIANKTNENQQLTKDDLLFLYEMNGKIEGFGYKRDPRIQELRNQRNPEEDMLIVFGCGKDQIARNSDEISENTKAYIGPLFKGIFQTNIEYIGTSFPEGMVKKMEAEIGGKSREKLIKELEEKQFVISDYAKSMLKSKDFTTEKNKEKINLVRLTVKDLGFPDSVTIEEIYKRAQELGLELCPAETGPNLRLQNSTPDQMLIAMKQITDFDGYPRVFGLGRYGGGLWLDDDWTYPEYRWSPEVEFVFRK